MDSYFEFKFTHNLCCEGALRGLAAYIHAYRHVVQTFKLTVQL